MAVRVEQLEITTSGNGWHIPKQIVKDWATLENTLSACCDTLLCSIQSNLRHFPIIASEDPPSKWGYRNCHPTAQDARTAALESLDGFAVYLAYTSYLLAICQFKLLPSDTEVSWLKQLRKSKIHLEYLDMLEESPLVDFTCKRKGVVLLVTEHLEMQIVDIFQYASIPIWFHWGQDPRYTTPLHAQVQYYRPPFSPPVSTASSTPSLPPEVPGTLFLSVIPGSSQRPGETMECFFHRRQQERIQRLKEETVEARGKRETRETMHASRPPPGKKGPRVYIWENVEGYRIRCPLTRVEAKNNWEHFKFRHLRYDSIQNCWDYCSAFDNDDFAAGAYDLDSDDDLDDFLVPLVEGDFPQHRGR